VFARTIGSEPGNNDPRYLAEAMRRDTRPYFLGAEAGMTGANFAIAETGSFVVCTNEGNADLSCREARWARRSRNTPRISARRGRAPSCTSCWSTTDDRNAWA
jgi:hypothetical protein